MPDIDDRFLPDPALDRAAMERRQREIAAAATFADDLPFDPDRVRLAEPFDLSRDVPEPGQRSLADARGRPDVPAPTVVGVDQAFPDARGRDSADADADDDPAADRVVSAAVAVRDGEVIERAHAVAPAGMAYVPGLLAFREARAALGALGALSVEPDLALLDGSGRIHFRQAGIATHLGVALDLPSVGVAKRLLCGAPDEPTDGRPAGWSTPIRADDGVEAPAGTLLGHAYQSRQWETPRINPLYVSPGHRVGAETATALVSRLCAGYKLPGPIRLADAYAGSVAGRL